MKSKTTVSTIFHCSLERAFKSPMLCEVTKVHTGFGNMPKVTRATEDESWGKVGGSRIVHMGNGTALDVVLERLENKYWKIEIKDLSVFSGGIEKFQGEWATEKIDDKHTKVIYTYTIFSKNALLFPLHWLYTKTFFTFYLKHVIECIKKLAYSEAPYTHP